MTTQTWTVTLEVATGAIRHREPGGHSAYVHPLNDGWVGFQARCWDCGWRGPVHLRGQEDLGSPEGRRHKTQAAADVVEHTDQTKDAFVAVQVQAVD